jgi:hypothetical protein
MSNIAPLAQSFKHSDVGGIFVTKVDLFFHSVNTDPGSFIFCELREMINGYPGPTVVPYSTVTKQPSDITVSTTNAIATQFKFESPVYLLPDVEYALVVGAPYDYSNKTKVWTSQMGELTLDGQIITKQPNNGAMFRSVNDSTWTAYSLNDICFRLYKAKFNTSRYGKLSLANLTFSSIEMDLDPFKLTSGSKTVRVHHLSHGLENGDWVQFSGSSYSALNNKFVVFNSTLDDFTVELQSNSAITAWTGGPSCFILSNKKIDTLYLNGKDMVLPDTHINYTYRTTNSARVQLQDDYPIQIKRNTNMSQPQFVLNNLNETQYLNDKSLKFDALLYSNNPNVSPVIDLSSMSAHIITNRINNVTESINLAIDANTLISGTVTDGVVFNSSGTITITDTTKFDEFDAIKIGQYIQFSGTSSNNNKLLVKAKEKTDTTYVLTIVSTIAVVNETCSSAITLKAFEMFIDPLAPGWTSSAANYISKILSIDKPATGFRLIFDYIKPTGATINIYFRYDLSSSKDNIETKIWDSVEETFIDTNVPIEKCIDLSPHTGIYDLVQVKIEFKSSNTSVVPKIKNFRLTSFV